MKNQPPTSLALAVAEAAPDAAKQAANWLVDLLRMPVKTAPHEEGMSVSDKIRVVDLVAKLSQQVPKRPSRDAQPYTATLPKA